MKLVVVMIWGKVGETGSYICKTITQWTLRTVKGIGMVAFASGAL